MIYLLVYDGPRGPVHVILHFKASCFGTTKLNSPNSLHQIQSIGNVKIARIKIWNLRLELMLKSFKLFSLCAWYFLPNHLSDLTVIFHLNLGF
jgi:hypothetical protein